MTVRVWRRRPGTALSVLAIAAVLGATVLAAPAPLTPVAEAAQPQCFTETNFCIDEQAFQDYFRLRGGSRILGFPISREFTLEGFSVQFFQRVVLQLQNGQVARLNLLDPGLMPLQRANGSTFPAPDPSVVNRAPKVDDPNYADQAAQFVHDVAPDVYQGQPVGFFNLFNTTVPVDQAFPNGNANPTLVTLLNLEIWGLPTSNPTPDPANPNFIYQRFQRGIMHYQSVCSAPGGGQSGPCTEGILVGEYFKSVITGQDLPPDLGADMAGSRFAGQYAPGAPNWLTRPADLTNTDLTGAFEAGQDSAQAKPRIVMQPSEVGQLSSVLQSNGLGVASVNVWRTISSVLPSQPVTSVAPLVSPPTSDARDLTQKSGGVPVGVLLARQSLPISGHGSLNPNVYLVRVQQGQIQFVGSDGHTINAGSADVRGLTRWISPPQTIATYKDVCFSWNLVQVCAPVPPLGQSQEAIEPPMRAAMDALHGQLGNASIDPNASVSEAEGSQAVSARQASLIAAPVAGPAGPQRLPPRDGAVLGVIHVMLPIAVPGNPTVPPGDYVVRAAAAQGQWLARLTAADGHQLDLPGRALEVRGGADQPLAIIANLCWFGDDLCMFDEGF